MVMATRPRLVPTLTDRDRALSYPRNMKEPGTPEWCWQTLELLKMRYRAVDTEWQGVQRARAELAEVKAWEIIPPENPYGSEEALLRAELGETLQQVERRIQSAAHAARQAAVDGPLADAHHAGPGRGNKTVDNINRFNGTNASYLARRILRDRPDIHSRMLAGEFPSVRQAAIEAGIVRPPTPVEQALKLLPKLTPDERRLVRDAIDALTED